MIFNSLLKNDQIYEESLHNVCGGNDYIELMQKLELRNLREVVDTNKVNIE